MSLPVQNQGKIITTDNLLDFSTRQIYELDGALLGLAEAIKALADDVEYLEQQGGGGTAVNDFESVCKRYLTDNTTVVVNKDAYDNVTSIVETGANGTLTSTFSDVNNVKTITSTLVPTSGSVNHVLTTVISTDNLGRRSVTSTYTKPAK